MKIDIIRCTINIKTGPKIIIGEYNQTYHTSPSCYYVVDLLCHICSKERISTLKIFNFFHSRTLKVGDESAIFAADFSPDGQLVGLLK